MSDLPKSPPRSPFNLTQLIDYPDCEKISCIAEEYEDELLSNNEVNRSIETLRRRQRKGRLTFRQIRKFLYRDFLLNTNWASCTRGVRVPLPKCVIQNIRSRYPDSGEAYTGFHMNAGNSANAVDRDGYTINDLFWVRRGTIYILMDSQGIEVPTSEGEACNVHYY